MPDGLALLGVEEVTGALGSECTAERFLLRKRPSLASKRLKEIQRSGTVVCSVIG
jgi:hypothetical protein